MVCRLLKSLESACDEDRNRILNGPGHGVRGGRRSPLVGGGLRAQASRTLSYSTDLRAAEVIEASPLRSVQADSAAPGVPEQGWSGKLIQDWAVQGLDESQRRRPQWRGERKAVLVRVPVALADDLARSAALERRSVSEHVTILLTQVMQGRDET